MSAVYDAATEVREELRRLSNTVESCLPDRRERIATAVYARLMWHLAGRESPAEVARVATRAVELADALAAALDYGPRPGA